MAPRGPFANASGKPEVTFKPGPRSCTSTCSEVASSIGANSLSSARSERSLRSQGSRASRGSRGAASAGSASQRQNEGAPTLLEQTLISVPEAPASEAATPRGAASTPRAASQPPVSAATPRSEEASVLDGYYGARVQRHVRTRRLYGNAPLLRSNIDDIVYGRDLDLSGDNDHSPEMLHLLDSYQGAAGHKAAMAQCMTGKNPDEPSLYCLRPAHVIHSQGLNSYAGLPVAVKKEAKRIWPKNIMQSSSVGEVVFGNGEIQKNHDRNSSEARLLDVYHQSGGRPGHAIRSWTENGREAAPTRKRIFTNAPAATSNMDRTVHFQNGSSTPRDAKTEADNNAAKSHLLKSFQGAAGVSPRLVRDSSGTVSHHGEANTGYTHSIYRAQSGNFVRSIKI
eukprot:TRINITY_DN31983_c0_g1_i1.p1 TRINITY_DN31983_c0_g1~~TRINITY_DN31983_c0_g1_i1.p1  ORF type:complete len:428 (+),score=56.52 TRINITY_DN31983_c0_g1_i1:99-1286(+)